jgi:hypothetical protein
MRVRGAYAPRNIDQKLGCNRRANSILRLWLRLSTPNLRESVFIRGCFSLSRSTPDKFYKHDRFYFSHSLDTTLTKKQNRARFISELFCR